MVEKDGERREPLLRSAIWPEIFQRWELGESQEAIAQDFGLSPVTIRDRCRWVENIFPPNAPIRLRAQLACRLDDALATLLSGKAMDAERQAKAVTAILRAARELESWTMDNANSKTQGAPVSEPEVSREHDDPNAELERRLLRLLDIERKRRAGQQGGGAIVEGVEAVPGEGPSG